MKRYTFYTITKYGTKTNQVEIIAKNEEIAQDKAIAMGLDVDLFYFEENKLEQKYNDFLLSVVFNGKI